MAHYLIHSYDYPPIAEPRGLAAARRYAGIAPGSPRMPCTCPRTSSPAKAPGRNRSRPTWPPAAAAKNHMDQLHAMDYLAYAYLQEAQDAAAKRVLEEAGAIRKGDPGALRDRLRAGGDPGPLYPGARRWADASSLVLQPTDFPWDRFPQSEAVLVFARALGAARSGNATFARRDMESAPDPARRPRGRQAGLLG
ncbi:MAG: hypothetical protein MZW92_49130 [Comamonadaceae bacterium]|nr:hypothetical protein [Comamonadaceae bacterium]